VLPSWVRSYIGVPFQHCGRTRDGWDCYGLVCTALWEQFGVLLPSYDGRYDCSTDTEGITQLIQDGIPLLRAKVVDNPLPGDIVWMRIYGRAPHVGLYVGDRYVLHCTIPKDTVVELIDTPYLRSRIVGYYRVGTCPLN
jgi:cell wall-associated NlpC family hydrolase